MQGCLYHRSSKMRSPVGFASNQFDWFHFLIPYNDFISRKQSTIP